MKHEMKKERRLPRHKALTFAAVLAGLTVIIIIGAVMSVQRYRRTVLVPLDSEGGLIIGNETGLEEIRRQLQEFNDDDSTGKILWTSAVCVTEYETWGGQPSIYYVCPFLVADSADMITEEPREWTLSLHFAMSATRGDELISFNKVYDLRNITLDCKSGKSAAVVDAWTSDMEMGVTTVNGDSFSYEFADRESISTETQIRTSLTLATKEAVGNLLVEKDSAAEKKDTLIVNWTFRLEESGHLIQDLDGVQIEVPYTADGQVSE